MKRQANIPFFETHALGKGLPFAIVESDLLVENPDLFSPSLRDFHVIFWVKQGEVRYFIDFEEYNIQPNSLILVAKDHLHYFAPFEEEVELQSIVFSPEFIYRNDSDLKHLFSFNAAGHFRGVHILEVPQKEVPSFEVISEQLKSVYQGWVGQEMEQAFYHLLCLFLLQCERMQKTGDDHLVDENTKLRMEFNVLLEQHFKQEHKVEFYAQKLSVSVKTLTRLIKEQYGTSSKQYIDNRRVLEIKRQLKGTTKAVKEIAYEMGFDEPTNMVKFFKKHLGLTPQAFRTQG